MWFLGDYGDENGDFSGGWFWGGGDEKNDVEVNDNPQNKGDTVFVCGMILFCVDVGIGIRSCHSEKQKLPLSAKTIAIANSTN